MSSSDIIENDNSAVISACGKYRYKLTRWWSADADGDHAVFIMLNPSTADATNDDPTIRRCIGFAQAWGCTSTTVVNLFAFRSTDPNALSAAIDPVGPMNDGYILDAVKDSKFVVCAWGAHKSAVSRASHVLNLLRANSVDPKCLRMTKSGFPSHPLYLPKGLNPVSFEEARNG